MSKLLVIGGTGFFGKSIIDAYLRQELIPWGISEITVLSRHASLLRLSQPFLLNESIKLLDANIATCTSLPFADYVIHAAASTDAKKYLTQPLLEKKNILGATINFAKLARQFLHGSKILYVSSGAVYGQQDSHETLLDEESPLKSINTLPDVKRDYAAAKRDSEEIIQSLVLDGLEVSIARCFAFVGRHLPRNQHFAIGNFIEDGLSFRDIKINSNYLVYRSYMHSDDLVIWLMTIAASANLYCPTYNVGSNEVIELRSLAEIVSNYFGVGVQAPDLLNDAVDMYVPSTEKAFINLGLRCKYDLRKSISMVINEIQEV